MRLIHRMRPLLYFLFFLALFFVLLKFIQGRIPPPYVPPPVPTATRIPRPSATYSVRTIPLIPYGMYTGPSYSHLKPGTRFTYKGVTYHLMAGAQGRLWGLTPQDKLVLLYGTRSQYDTY